MEIISRSEAIKRGLPQYFTNLPCRNGHIAYRYTRSGSCSGCVAASNGPIEEIKQRKEVRAKLSEMVSFRARCFPEDLAYFRSIVLAAVQAREPGAQLADVWHSQTGKLHACGTSVFTFHCFAADAEMLQATAIEIFNQRNNKIPFKIPAPYKPPAEEWPAGDPR